MLNLFVCIANRKWKELYDLCMPVSRCLALQASEDERVKAASAVFGLKEAQLRVSFLSAQAHANVVLSASSFVQHLQDFQYACTFLQVK